MTQIVLTAGSGPIVFDDTFSCLTTTLVKYIATYGHRAFYFPVNDVISFPVRRRWTDRDDLWIIRESARQAVAIANKYSLREIQVPKIDMTFQWDIIKSYLTDIFDKRFVFCEGLQLIVT